MALNTYQSIVSYAGLRSLSTNTVFTNHSQEQSHFVPLAKQMFSGVYWNKPVCLCAVSMFVCVQNSSLCENTGSGIKVTFNDSSSFLQDFVQLKATQLLTG